MNHIDSISSEPVNFDKAANMSKNDIIKNSIPGIIGKIYNSNSNHILGSESQKLIKNTEQLFLYHFKMFNEVEFIPGGASIANKRAIIGSIPIKPKFIDNNKRIDTVLISSIEHKSIDDIVINELIIRGYNVIKIPVNSNGIIDIYHFTNLLNEFNSRIALISIMLVNNETGKIQPIKDLLNITKEKNSNIVFHSDICQGVPIFFKIFGYPLVEELPLNTVNTTTTNNLDDIVLSLDNNIVLSTQLYPDIVTLSMYKLGGLSQGIMCYDNKIILGNDYFGTPDALSIYLSGIVLDDYMKYLDDKIIGDLKVKTELRKECVALFDELNLPYIDLSEETSATNIQSYLLPTGYQSKTIQKMLSDMNVCVSTGSACALQKKIGSHVLKAMGYDNQTTFGLLRFSFDKDNYKDIDYLISCLKIVLTKVNTLFNIKQIQFVKTNPITSTNSTISDIVKPNLSKLDVPLDMVLDDIKYNCVKISVGELYLKGDNKKTYLFTLRNNIRQILDKKWAIQMYNNYILILSNSEIEICNNKEIYTICNQITNIAGISKITPCYAIINTRDRNIILRIVSIVSKIYESATERYKFKIDTKIKEIDQLYGYKSNIWNILLGQYITDRFEKSVVNLGNPDITINITVYKNNILINYESFKGFQGLPSGSSGKIMCILDISNYQRSIVSCYKFIGRGMKIDILVSNTDIDNPIIVSSIDIISKYQHHTKIINTDPNKINPTSLSKLSNTFIWEKPQEIKKEIFLQKITIFEKKYNYLIINSTTNETNEEIDNLLSKISDQRFRYYNDLKDINEDSVFYKKFIGYDDITENNQVVMLLSGGIDSPVASYKLLNNGFDIKYYLHFATDINKIDNILKIKELLGYDTNLLVVDFKELQEEIVKTCYESYRTIMYKAFMIIIANNVAKKYNIGFIGTGNALGQVASQTLQNIRVSHIVSDNPIISPLIGYNKENIIKIANQIGTYHPSTCGGTGDCCVMYLSKHPVINAKIDLINRFIKIVDKKLVNDITIKLV